MTNELPTEGTAPENSIYYHESGDLFVEDVEQHLAVLPEVVTSTEEVTMEDIQVGDPGIPLSEGSGSITTVDLEESTFAHWKR